MTTISSNTKQTLTVPQALQLAAQSLQKGEFQQAEQLCRQILQAAPNESNALHLLGVIAYHAKQHQDAIELMQQAIIQSPKLFDAYFNLAAIFQELKKYREAISWYEKGFTQRFNFKKATIENIFDFICNSHPNEWHLNKKYFLQYTYCLEQHQGILKTEIIEKVTLLIPSLALEKFSEPEAQFVVFSLLELLQFSKLSTRDWNEKIVEYVALPLMQKALAAQFKNISFMLRVHIITNYVKQFDDDILLESSKLVKRLNSLYKMPSESEIIAHWKKTDDKPIVSIICIAYNHERFISDALDSFLIQETEFPYEIIVHDDASTDNTVAILKTYQEKYPNLIRLILQKENQYSQGKKPLDIVLPITQGSYIATCEGDDFWIDYTKLQKQIEFLEAHSDYSCCYHGFLNMIHKTGELQIVLPNQENNTNRYIDFSQNDLKKCKVMARIPTLIFRKSFAFRPEEIKNIKNGDKFLTSLLGLYGKGAYFNEYYAAVARNNEFSMWVPLPQNKKNEHSVVSFYWIAVFYARIGDKEMSEYWANRCQDRLNGVFKKLLAPIE